MFFKGEGVASGTQQGRAQLICGAGSGNNFGSTAAVSSGDSRAGSGGMEPGLLALQMAEAC